MRVLGARKATMWQAGGHGAGEANMQRAGQRGTYLKDPPWTGCVQGIRLSVHQKARAMSAR